MAAKVPRIYTGLAGLPVIKQPQLELAKWYDRVMRKMDKLPPTCAYRIQTEKIVRERQAIVQSTSDRDEIERKIGDGLCEELIEKAKLEMELIDTMQKYEPWEPLTDKPPANQWKWPL